MSTSPTKLTYRIEEAVAATGLTKSTLYERMQAGELAFYKVGRIRLIPADSLEEFLHRHQSGDAARVTTSS